MVTLKTLLTECTWSKAFSILKNHIACPPLSVLLGLWGEFHTLCFEVTTLTNVYLWGTSRSHKVLNQVSNDGGSLVVILFFTKNVCATRAACEGALILCSIHLFCSHPWLKFNHQSRTTTHIHVDSRLNIKCCMICWNMNNSTNIKKMMSIGFIF